MSRGEIVCDYVLSKWFETVVIAYGLGPFGFFLATTFDGSFWLQEEVVREAY